MSISMKKILVVDDEKAIRLLLKVNLEKVGYSVKEACNGVEALKCLEKTPFDLVVLDVMMPELDGIDVCRRVKVLYPNMPIIMLSAKSEEIDRILGLEMGADDYVAKPFSPRELLARIKAVFRRVEQYSHNEIASNQFCCGDIVLDKNTYKVFVNHQEVKLTLKEFELLFYFMKNANRVLSRQRLIDAIWQYDFSGETRMIDVHIANLREKIEKNPKEPWYIKTVRGVGYQFKGDL